MVRLDAAGLITSRTLGRNRLVCFNARHPAGAALTQLHAVTFGPRVVIAGEVAISGAEQVVIFGSWAARYAGQAGPPPLDIDVLVVGEGPPRAATTPSSKPPGRSSDPASASSVPPRTNPLIDAFLDDAS